MCVTCGELHGKSSEVVSWKPLDWIVMLNLRLIFRLLMQSTVCERETETEGTFNEMPYMCVSYSLMGIWAGGCWYLCSFAHILKWAKMINTIYS